MKIGLFRPTTLLGQELRERLTGTLGADATWTLLGVGDEIGTVSEIGRTPALVEDAEAVDVSALDLLITCEASRDELGQLLAGHHRPIVLQVAAESVCTDGVPLVGGLTAEISGQRSLSAANAINIVLASVLESLRELAPRQLTSTVLLPVSVHGRSALDEVLDQARALLAFQEVPPASVLGAQLAFNLLRPGTSHRRAPEPAELERELRILTGTEIGSAYGVLHAGVFHGLGILTRVELSGPSDPDTVRRALLSGRLVEAPHADVGPIDTASREDVILGSITTADRPNAFWLWLLADNLALTAANAAAIVESLALGAQSDQAN